MRMIAFIAATVVSAPVFAAQTPKPLPYDSRVRSVTYNALDVVRLPAVPGVATHIQLEDGEEVVQSPLGDHKAIEVMVHGNNIWAKPVGPGGSSLSIVTDRRIYNIWFEYTPNRRAAVMQLRFEYPESEDRKRRERALAAVRDRAFEQRHASYNLAYRMAGDLGIGPVNTWDDGTHTYFKFAAGLNLPAVYEVDAAGAEIIVNRVMHGGAENIIGVSKVSPRWRLRLGEDQVVEIRNDAFSAAANATGTISPAVRRVIKTGGE